MDAALLGGPQTTFVGVGVVEDQLFGAYAGDSRAYLVGEHGCQVLTEASSPRLGSGRVEPQPIHTRLAPRDVVVLMSDGAWTPLSLAASDHRLVFPVEPEDLMYTLYSKFGIDPNHEFQSSIGRPVRVANGGKMIAGLFA